MTVTDNSGATATDVVNITVQDNGGVDTTPPITTGTFTRSTAKGRAYFDIGLSVNKTATTHFRLISGATIISGGNPVAEWQTYTGVINILIDKGGSANFEYYSVDSSNNTEATKTELLQ